MVEKVDKTILVAGKYLPDGFDFIDGISLSGRNVVASVSEGVKLKNSSEENIATCLWNKMSPVSARAFVLECENNFRKIDEAILVFDESYFAEKFNEINYENSSRGVDEMILGFQYLVQELLSKFEKRFTQNYGIDDFVKQAKLVFYLKTSSEEIDVLKNNSVRQTVSLVANPIVAASRGAFESFAENIAALYGNRDFVNIVLVKGDSQNELCKNERNFSSWMCQYLDDVEKLKTKLSAKQSASWIKAGSKSPSNGFLFLK